MHGFWSVEELANGCTDFGEVARGGCLVAGNFSLRTSTTSTEGQKIADEI